MQIREKNIIRKTWQSDQLHIALVYPNQYSAMSGLTIQTLYNLWNSCESVVCERFFIPNRSQLISSYKKWRNLPQTSQEVIHPAQLKPPLKSLENQIPLLNFDIAAFSLCYELDYPHLVWILENAKIPLSRKKRELENVKEQKYPLILTGGPAIRSNPVPLKKIVDLVFIGEIEDQNNDFLNAFFEEYINPYQKSTRQQKHDAGNRKKTPQQSQTINFSKRHINDSYSNIYDSIKKKEVEVKSKIPEKIKVKHSDYWNYLRRISKLEGFWVPEIENKKGKKVRNNTIRRVYVRDLDKSPHPIKQIIPLEDAKEFNLPFGKAFYLEVNRGCPHKCHFCMTGHQVNPFRNRSLSNLKDIITRGLINTPVNKVVLIGSTVSEHPEFEKICNFLIEKEVQFSIPSLRIDTITPDIAKKIKKSGMKTVAIAPETGNLETRKKINKYITNEHIIDGCRILLEANIPQIKLYFLYGFPFETDQDIEDIIDLTLKIADLGYGKGAVKLSVNPFIPKAHTPFESFFSFFVNQNMKTLKHRKTLIENKLKGNIQIKLQTLDLEEAYIQAIFSLGDERLHQFIKMCSKFPYMKKRWYRMAKKEGIENIIDGLWGDLEKSMYSNNPDYPWTFIKQNLD